LCVVEAWPRRLNRNRGAHAGGMHLAGLRALFWNLRNQEGQCVKTGARFQAPIGGKLSKIKARRQRSEACQACWGEPPRLGSCVDLEPRQPPHRVFARVPAHLARGLESRAKGRSLRSAEQCAAPVGGELHARDTGRFALGHARNGLGDGRRDATGTAAAVAAHVPIVQGAIAQAAVGA
jgi:hypothetical protein